MSDQETEEHEDGSETLQLDNPIDFIAVAAEMLGWKIALPPEDEHGNLQGVLIGTEEFLEEEVFDLEKYDILEPMAVENEEVI